MGGNAAKIFLVFALSALLALGLVACGGGSDSSSSESTATQSSQPATTTPSGQSKGRTDDRASNEKQSGDDAGGSTSSSGSSGEDDSNSSSNSDERSAEFRTPGGDNSIQNYGDEADEDEIAEVEEVVAGYLDARAEGEWEKSCQYLGTQSKESLEQLSEKSPTLKGKGCGAIIAALSAQVPASARKSPLVEGIASVRFKGDHGFALFHGPHGVAFFIPVLKEGDKWKVASLVASELI